MHQRIGLGHEDLLVGVGSVVVTVVFVVFVEQLVFVQVLELVSVITTGVQQKAEVSLVAANALGIRLRTFFEPLRLA